MFEQGVIRPPSEANSLLVRVTRNCPWNRCLFCPAYKGTSFSRRSVEEIKKDLGLWSCCIGGAITPDETTQLLTRAGFTDISITENENSRDLVEGWKSDTGKNDLDIVSAYIEAVKPGK